MLSEQTYSALLVSSSPKLQEVLMQTVPEMRDFSLETVGSISAARRAVMGKSYDMIIINAPLPDEFGSRFAADAVERPGCVVLMLLRGEVYEETSAKLTGQGIFTLQKPITAQSIRNALQWMQTTRERLRVLERKASTVEEKMEEIRLVNRAKWLLIEQLKMSEPDAHRYIEKQAMDRCAPRREIAKNIIKTYT